MDVLMRLQKLMDARGWSEYRLAKESGLSNSTISNIFRRNNSPTIPTLETLCAAFGLSLSQFFSDGDEPVELTPDQKILFDKWITLTARQKEIILAIIEEL